MKIGVFDSGIGGLTVVKSLLKHQYFKEIIYYGDTARVPYGVKDENTIIRYAIDAIEFFKNFEIDLLIVACNTVSAYALPAMREIAPFPIVGVVDPGILAVKSLKLQKNDPILIVATQATIASKAYETPLLKDGYSDITAIATGLFVPIVEEGLIDTDILTASFNHYFKSINKPKTIILGCTHFPLISKEISHFFDDESTLIHSGEAIVEYLQSHFDFSLTFEETKVKFFASENPDALKKIAHSWLDI